MTRDETRVALLEQLSQRHPGFLVWKHLDRSLVGQGDVDAAAPAHEVQVISADAMAIAKRTIGATTVILCQHVADKHLQFFVQPDRLPQLFELDICTQPSRGLAPWAPPQRMARLTTMTPQGIRSLRTGAESIVSLVYHGISAGGHDRLRGYEREIVRVGLAGDMDGAVQACKLLVPALARGHVLELARRCAEGDWDPMTASRAHRGFIATGLHHPLFSARRAAFRLRLAAGRECVMSRLARRHDRRVAAEDLDVLLRLAATQGHVVSSC